MFKLKPNPTFIADVEIPKADGPEPLKLIFKHKGLKALKAFYDSLPPTKDKAGKVIKEGRTDEDALLELVEGWVDVDAEFTPEAFGQLLDDYPGSASAIFVTYGRALQEGKQKN